MRLEYRNNFKNKVKNVYVFLESIQILFISQIQKYLSNKSKHVMILLNHNYSHNMNKYKRLNLIHYFKESNKLIKKIIQIIKLFKHQLLELNFNE